MDDMNWSMSTACHEFFEVGVVETGAGDDESGRAGADADVSGPRRIEVLGVGGEAEGDSTAEVRHVSHRRRAMREVGMQMRDSAPAQVTRQPQSLDRVPQRYPRPVHREQRPGNPAKAPRTGHRLKRSTGQEIAPAPQGVTGGLDVHDLRAQLLRLGTNHALVRIHQRVHGHIDALPAYLEDLIHYER